VASCSFARATSGPGGRRATTSACGGKGQTPRTRSEAEALALASWNLIVTNIPATVLQAQQVLLLYRARWQVELLFKLWKSHGHVDEWSSVTPPHILCEFYAKLLAMLVEHWLLLQSCWDDPHRSWILSADLLRDQVPLLLQGLRGRLPLDQVLQLIVLRFSRQRLSACTNHAPQHLSSIA
jgi:hypothetical protein